MSEDRLAPVDPAELRVRVDTPGGPGGQHANRTKSRVTVELDLRTATLEDRVRERLQAVFGNVVRSSSTSSRSQLENRRAAEARLLARIDDALRESPPRRRTAPSRSAVERRLNDKRRRGSIKRLRTEGAEE